MFKFAIDLSYDNADCILMPIFPLEIEEIILDLLAEDEEDKEHSALKACSLVCQAFLHICRKHIFANIVLNDHCNMTDLLSKSSSSHAFDRLLHETPKIADYIRNFDYTIQSADLASASMQESLSRISRLESFAVNQQNMPRFDWRNNPIRPVLLHLLHLPTLTHFKVDHICHFLVTDLMPCVNLKSLDIGYLTGLGAVYTFPLAFLERSVQLDEFVGRKPASVVHFYTARRPDGHPIIDFRSLSRITVVLENPMEGIAAQELFRHCHDLIDVQISFWNARNVRPSLADMLRPSMQNLEHITVKIDVDGDDVDPLFDIPFELERMRTDNFIESVTIVILVQVGFSCHRGDDWGRLDEVLTTPGWFSSLEWVSLTIELASVDENAGNEELEVALRNLSETQFSRLSSSNSVKFFFEVNAILV